MEKKHADVKSQFHDRSVGNKRWFTDMEEKHVQDMRRSVSVTWGGAGSSGGDGR